MKHLAARALADTMTVTHRFRSMFCSSARAEAGQVLVEYALVLVFVSIVMMAGLTLLGQTTSQVLNLFQTNLTAYDTRHA